MRSHSAIIPAATMPPTVAKQGRPAASLAICLRRSMTSTLSLTVSALRFGFLRSDMRFALSAAGTSLATCCPRFPLMTQLSSASTVDANRCP